jgi:hypothetical protein
MGLLLFLSSIDAYMTLLVPFRVLIFSSPSNVHQLNLCLNRCWIP